MGQVLRALVEFTSQHGALDVPVVLTGDLNCTSFGRLRGVANTLSLMNREARCVRESPLRSLGGAASLHLRLRRRADRSDLSDDGPVYAH